MTQGPSPDSLPAGPGGADEAFHALADSVDQMIWSTRPDGFHDYYNRRWYEFTGVPAGSTDGAAWAGMFHPDDQDRAWAAWRRALETGERYEIEYRLRHHSGAYRWVLGRAQAVRGADGAIARWYGTCTDIDEMKRIEDALRESEQRFRNMADHAPVMMWVTRTDGFCTYLNRLWYDFTGQSPDEAEGFGWLDATHPDDRAEAERAFLEATRTASPFRVEYRLRRADGTYRWAIDAATPRFAEDGAFLGFVGSVIDIDERRDAELRLQQSEDRLRMATLAARIGTWDYDLRTLDLRWDDRCKELFGLGPGAHVDYEVFLAGIHPDDRAMADAAVQAAIAPGGEGYDVEFRTVGLDDGIERWIRATGRAVFDEARGDASRFVGTVLDISPQKRAGTALARSEAELRLLNETLESRVAAEIEQRADAEARLRQAQKMETVGQLTGGVAHDFNNLLQVVTGNLEILIRNLPDDAPRLRRSAVNALRGAERATTLTQRLLAFSRRQPLDPKPTRIDKLVAGMSELLHRALGETVELETVLSPRLWLVEIDPNQLENAILNLAVNARDAMPAGGRLTIETANTHLDRAYTAEHSDVAPGQYVVLCVSDTGEGMSEETLGRVFEPFFTTKDVGRGTGLGLSMVYGFVKQSGGHVKIYSEAGHGTTVRIYLPRHHGSAEASAPEAETIVAGGSAEIILVCEDDEDVRAYSVEVLSELGYRVLEAADGAAALRILSRPDQPVDLLFTDVVLPGGMTGAEVAAQARALRPTLKILFTTGYARNAIVHHGRLDPGVALVTKPFTYADLAARVREMLDS